MTDDQSLPNTPNATETNPTPAPPVSWDSLKLSPEALELIKKAGYQQPSPVQALTIPIAVDGIDVIASAQTGTGKTASFVLPMVDAFVGRQGTFGLILAPTREIAQQIEATIQIFGAPRGVRSAVLIGGVDMRHDQKALDSYPQIIVATPGRLCDHLDRGNIWLDYIEMVVLDEADRMLDMGFSDQLSRIMKDVPENRQTLLFSATITPTVRKLAEKILYKPETVTIGKPLSAAKSVEQRVLWLKEEAKNRELMRLLRREPGSLIVFTRSKDGATRVWRSLHSAGFYDATYIHSDRLQSHRESALAEFKEGKYRIMIATDVAARGLHIDGVAHVVNYDLPMEAEDYVHRIGRTGRAGATGHSTTFVTDRDRGILREIEKLVGKPIPADYSDSYPRAGEGQSEGGRSGERGGSRDGGGRGGRDGQRGGGQGGGRGGQGGARGGEGQRGGQSQGPRQPQAQPAPVSAMPRAEGTIVAPRAEGEAPAAAGPRVGAARVSGGTKHEGPKVQGADAGPEGAPGEGAKRRRRGGRGRRGGKGGGAPEGGGSSGPGGAPQGGGGAFPV